MDVSADDTRDAFFIALDKWNTFFNVLFNGFLSGLFPTNYSQVLNPHVWLLDLPNAPMVEH